MSDEQKSNVVKMPTNPTTTADLCLLHEGQLFDREKIAFLVKAGLADEFAGMPRLSKAGRVILRGRMKALQRMLGDSVKEAELSS